MNFLPSSPMVSMTTDSSMKVTPASATCWIPAGTSESVFLPARRKIAAVMTTAAM